MRYNIEFRVLDLSDNSEYYNPTQCMIVEAPTRMEATREFAAEMVDVPYYEIVNMRAE